MSDALRRADQESYFRILADLDLLLPVSADAIAGLTPLGWGTWSTGGRTHVLAFTSPRALQACLADYAGTARRLAYRQLAETWPNFDWWLAVNPGLPIEGYLPSWFVAQLAHGNLRLPSRNAEPVRQQHPPAEREFVSGTAPAASSTVPAPYQLPSLVPAGTSGAAPVSGPSGDADQSAPPDHAAAIPMVPTPGGPLPRRPVTPPSDRPGSMAAAARALAEAQTVQQAALSQPMPAQVTGSSGVVPAPPISYGNPGDAPASATRAGDVAATSMASEQTTGAVQDQFRPANQVEQDLYAASTSNSTDAFLSTLLLATVLVPVASESRPGAQPGDAEFVFHTEQHGGERFLVVFTSLQRLANYRAEPVRTVSVRFFELIRNWPDPSWSFGVNPGTPVGAKLPGSQILALANWAVDAGLGADPAVTAVPAPGSQAVPQQRGGASDPPTVMQKTVPPEHVDHFLERGYDRVSGFVHRAAEVEHLRTPAALYTALGLGYAGSPYTDGEEAYLLRWPAYRPNLYRIPYGGQNEQALRAMDGWVIERAPFRGNGFAPGEGRDVIAEFKVDSVRLPHGSELWRLDAAGNERLVAIFDCDAPTWRRVGER